MRWALKQYLLTHSRRVERALNEPRQAQEETFARLQSTLSTAELAQALLACRRLEDCRALERHDAQTLQPVLDHALRSGSAAAFGSSKLEGFARTSGTTGHHKHIPLNRAYLESLDRTLLRLVACYFDRLDRWDQLLRGKQILLGSRPRVDASPTGLPISDISGFIPTRTWRILRRLYIPRHEDLFIEDWSERASRTLEQAKNEPVGSITGIPALARDFTKRARERFGVEHLSELWPALDLYVFGGGALSPEQREGIRKSWVGPSGKLAFVETYFATEAQLAFTFDPLRPGLMLNTLENLYLFVPVEGGEARLVDELEPGRRYHVHVTTPGGLVNYAMGDVLEVVSVSPLLIRFAGRVIDELSMTGEKVSLEQLDLALTEAGHGAVGVALAWVEEENERPRLAWGVPASLGHRDLGAWAALLDQSLCLHNSLYAEALRHEQVIGPSRVVPVADAALDNHYRAGLGIGQTKPKRIFDSRPELDFTLAPGLTRSELSLEEAQTAGS